MNITKRGVFSAILLTLSCSTYVPSLALAQKLGVTQPPQGAPAPVAVAVAAPPAAAPVPVGAPTTLDVPAAPSYTINITEPGIYRIDVAGEPADPVATLYDANNEMLERDDDGGGGKNSRITRMLAPGAYRLIVVEYAGQHMSARISVSRVPDPVVSARIQNAGTARVTTPAGSSDLDAAADIQLTIQRAGQYTIVAEAVGDSDPKMALIFNGASLEDDDDSGGGKNSKITRELSAGTYIVRVMNYDHSAATINVVVRPGGR